MKWKDPFAFFVLFVVAALAGWCSPAETPTAFVGLARAITPLLFIAGVLSAVLWHLDVRDARRRRNATVSEYARSSRPSRVESE